MMNEKEKPTRICPTCDRKGTCLERALGIHYMYICTGRAAELTEEVKGNFAFKRDCKNWKETQNK